MDINEIENLAKYYDDKDMSKAHFEYVLNILGYLPGVFVIGGMIRMVAGLISVLDYSSKRDFELYQALRSPSEEVRIAAEIQAEKNTEYEIHGRMNILRGFAETCLPFSGLVLLISDCLGGRHKYTAEKGGNLQLFEKIESVRLNKLVAA